MSAAIARRRNRAALRREHVIDTAARLMARDGYHATSMQALAQEAGVSVGSLYQYVENKTELLLVVLTTVLDELNGALAAAMEGDEDPVRALVAGFRAYCAGLDRRRDTAMLAYRETRSLPPAARALVQQLEVDGIRPLTGAIVAAQEEGAFETGLAAELVAHDLIVLAQGWALKHWRLSKLATLDRFISTQTALFLRGLLVPAQRARYGDLLEVHAGGS